MSELGKVQLNSDTAQQAVDNAARVNQQERAAASHGTSIRIGGAVQRVVYRGDDVTVSTERAVASGTNAPITQVGTPSPRDNSNVVAGKSPSGRPVSGADLRPDSVVSIGSMQSNLAALEAAGFVSRNASGVYEFTQKGNKFGSGNPQRTERAERATPQQALDPSNNPRLQHDLDLIKSGKATPQQFDAAWGDGAATEMLRQQPATRSDTAPLDQGGEALLQEFNENVLSHEFKAASRDVINSNGEISQDVIGLAARRLGVDPETAAAKAGTLRDSFQRQADAAIGPNAADVYKWGWAQNVAEMRTLVADFVSTGNTAGLKALAARHMQNLDTIDPQAILASEDGQKLKARLEPSGRVSIEHPTYGRALWSAAVKAGWFKPSYNK